MCFGCRSLVAVDNNDRLVLISRPTCDSRARVCVFVSHHNESNWRVSFHLLFHFRIAKWKSKMFNVRRKPCACECVFERVHEWISLLHSLSFSEREVNSVSCVAFFPPFVCLFAARVFFCRLFGCCCCVDSWFRFVLFSFGPFDTISLRAALLLGCCCCGCVVRSEWQWIFRFHHLPGLWCV